jgi:hypothetical protein
MRPRRRTCEGRARKRVMHALRAAHAAGALGTVLARSPTSAIARSLAAHAARALPVRSPRCCMSTAPTGAGKPRAPPSATEAAGASPTTPPPPPSSPPASSAAAKPRAAVTGGTVSTGRSRLRRWATAVGLAAGVAGLMWQANMSPRDLWDWVTALVSNLTERKLTDPTVEELMVRPWARGGAGVGGGEGVGELGFGTRTRHVRMPARCCAEGAGPLPTRGVPDAHHRPGGRAGEEGVGRE